jgi:O-antigen/teichoic acid export membrane protein
MTRLLGIIRANSGLAYVGLGNFIALAIHGLFWFILASMLTAEYYGELNYYISVAAISSVISTLGLGTTVVTYVAKGSKKIGSQANVVVLLSNAIGAVVLMIITNYYISLLLFATSFFSMTMAETLGMKLYKKYFFLVVAEKATQIVLAIALYYAMGLQGIIVGYALAALIFSYSFFRSLRNIYFGVSELKSRFTFTLHSYSLNISDSLALNADKLIIAPVFGFTVLGFYQLGFQFLLVLGVIPVSLFYYLLPQFSSGNNKRNVIFAALVLATLFASIAPITIPVLINMFFREYIDVIPTAQIMSVGIVPMTINSILNSSLLAKGHSKNVVIGAIVYISSLLSLFYSLGTLVGVVGLGISVVVSLSLQSLVLFLLSRRQSIDY